MITFKIFSSTQKYFHFLPGSLLQCPTQLCHHLQLSAHLLHDLLLDEPGAPDQPQLEQVAVLAVHQLLQHLGDLLCTLLHKPCNTF